jgi:hypothetical protein
MPGSTGGGWKRNATSVTAPVPDPTNLGIDLVEVRELQQVRVGDDGAAMGGDVAGRIVTEVR